MLHSSISFFTPALGIASSILFLWAAPVWGQYEFGDECVPATEHSVYREAPPALIVLDRSGSMRSKGNSEGESKMSIAQTVIAEVARGVHEQGECTAKDQRGCDTVKLGLGWFSSSAALSVMPGEDTLEEVVKRVKGFKASGGTHVGKAAQLIFLNKALASSKNVAIGVLITDGQPSAGNGNKTRDTVEQTLQYLCAARDRRPGQTLTFSVGFGAGSSPGMNSLFAAAGGTGECCVGVAGRACTYQPAEIVDPCKLPRRSGGRVDASLMTQGSKSDTLAKNAQCRGSLEADSGQALKNSFTGIFGRATCTFPLEVPGSYPSYPGAESDPEATLVLMDHTTFGPDTRISYVGNEYVLRPGDSSPTRKKPEETPTRRASFERSAKSKDTAERYGSEGWIWANPQRTAILLTENLCQDAVSARRISNLRTQIACQCPNTDEACEVPCFKEGCLEFRGCASRAGQAKEACEQSCKYDKDSACERGKNELYGREELQQVGRCSPGTISCLRGREYCQPDYSPQPEICNGRDDDCNAVTDDLSSAKPGGKGLAYDPADPAQKGAIDSTPAGESLFCGFQDDRCGCAGAPDSYGMPARISSNQGFGQMALEADRSTSVCRCVNALSLGHEEAVVSDGAAAGDHQLGGCATSPGGNPLGEFGLIAAALGWVLRRRQRR